VGFRDDRHLLLTAPIVSIDDQPVMSFSELMGSGGIGEQGGVVPIASLCMEDGKPGVALGIETTGSNKTKDPCGCLFSVLVVNTE
jgi:hypothetical protein